MSRYPMLSSGLVLAQSQLTANRHGHPRVCGRAPLTYLPDNDVQSAGGHVDDFAYWESYLGEDALLRFYWD